MRELSQEARILASGSGRRRREGRLARRGPSRGRVPAAAAGQCTLTGDSSFCRATTKACARSDTSASTAPSVEWIA